ncbi:hypothetical protein BH11MYX1_BH11MYX1_35040 [soil metagenome]
MLVALWAAGAGVANAGGKKKIVVLDFKGPEGEKFHDDVVKLVEADSTVVNTDKYNGTAEELDAKAPNTKNIKKVAKKLKLDGVVWGKVEKTDDGYTLKLKLRAGASGEVVGEEIVTTTKGAKLGKKAKKELKGSLIPAIEGLEAGGGDAEPEVKKDPEPETKKDPEVKVKEADTDECAGLKGKKLKKCKQKRVAANDGKGGEGGEGGEGGGDVNATVEVAPLTADEALLPQNRAVDFTIGMSFIARKLTFASTDALSVKPSGYNQSVPVPGGIMDVTVYPYAFSHKNRGLLTGLGIELMYDKVIYISSKKTYTDDATMSLKTASINTTEARFSVGAVLRYPVSQSLLVGARLLYSFQQFNLEPTFAGGMKTDVPNVGYKMAEPKVFLRYQLGGSIGVDADVGFMLVTNTGGIQASTSSGYGPATVSGYEANLGFDYTLTKNLFVRALVRYETISLAFKGDTASESNTRDGDPTTQDVKSAKDLYYGATAAIGYAF